MVIPPRSRSLGHEASASIFRTRFLQITLAQVLRVHGLRCDDFSGVRRTRRELPVTRTVQLRNCGDTEKGIEEPGGAIHWHLTLVRESWEQFEEQAKVFEGSSSPGVFLYTGSSWDVCRRVCVCYTLS